MGTSVLFVSRPVLWTGDLKNTKTGSPTRGVLVGLDRNEEKPMPPCFVRVFGSDAEAVNKGDRLAVEGDLEAEVGERDGKPAVRLSIMAKWSKLTGYAGARQQRSKAAKKGTEMRRRGDHQPVINATAPFGQPSRDPPPFDDRLDDLF